MTRKKDIMSKQQKDNKRRNCSSRQIVNNMSKKGISPLPKFKIIKNDGNTKNGKKK